MAQISEERGKINVCYYVVSLLDVLGQREKMARLEPLPEGEDGRQRTFDLLIKSAGFVVKLRGLLQKIYDQDTAPPKELEGSPFAEMLKANPTKLESFSDTVVSYASLRSTEENGFPIVGLYGMLGATAGAMLAAMNDGHVLRGGIDVGIGTDLKENEIYGPVLLKAYKLESCVAKQFPRIAVGPTMETFLAEMACLPNDTPAHTYTSWLAKRCQRLLSKDGDGVTILDYAGDEMVAIEGQPAKDFVLHAHQFVKQELQRFEREDNKKLVEKYDYLNKYFESRVRSWE